MAPWGIIMLTPVSMELRTPPLELKIPRAVATTVWPSSSSSSSSRALGLGDKMVYFFLDLTFNQRINYPLVRLGVRYLTGMALGTALMLLCWCLERWSMVRVKVSTPLSWSVFWGWGGTWGFSGLVLLACFKTQKYSVGHSRQIPQKCETGLMIITVWWWLVPF